TEAREWPETGRPRRAGVSSFGVSGTNAHVILEHIAEPDPVPEPVAQEPGSGGVVALVVSGCGVGGMQAQAGQVASFIGEHPEVGVGDIGWSLVTTRAVLADRGVVVATNREAALTGLAELARGEPAPGVVSGCAMGDAGGVGVMFSGQGSQYVGMGQELHQAYPVFAEAFDTACAGLDADLAGHVDWSVRDVVFGTADPGLVDETVFTQAGLFAVGMGLYRLVESWGVRADVVMGHSVGEITAAHVSGVLSLPDACALVAARGRLMQALPRGGGMVAVAASEEELSLLIAGCAGRLAIAAVNSPNSVVISGDDKEMATVLGECTRRGWRIRRLRVSHAFHSPCMDQMVEEFQDVVRKLSWGTAKIPVVSNITGELADETVLGNPGYWGAHARQTVRFADGVRCVRAMGVRSFIEIGPGGVLAGLVHQCVEHDRDHVADVTVLAGLRRGAEVTGMLSTAAELFARGLSIDWATVIGRGRQVELPTYAFQHQRYWLESSASTVTGVAPKLGLGAVEHPLLGAVVGLAEGAGVVFTARLSLATHPWLADHVVSGTTVVAGAVFVELVIRAGDEVDCAVVEELVMEAPLLLPERGGVRVQVTVGGNDQAGLRAVSIHSVSDDTPATAVWTCHARGFITNNNPQPGTDLQAWPPVGTLPVSVEGFYQRQAEAGYEYGPVFQGLRAAWTREGEMFAEIALPEDRRGEASGFGLHPALLDAALHATALAATPGGVGVGDGEVLLPFSWNGVVLHASGASVLRVRAVSAGVGVVSLQLADQSGQPVASIESLVFRPVSVELLTLSSIMPPLLRGLVRQGRRIVQDDLPAKESLVQRLAGLPEADQERVLLDLVWTHSAIVLGHSLGETTETLRAFKDMGFDSLTAVALRNRIAAATGISLPATVLFDHPTPAALSRLLRDELCADSMASPVPVLAELDSLETSLMSFSDNDVTRTIITARLQRIMSMWRDAAPVVESSDVASRIQMATTSEVLDFIDQQLGRAGELN
ncbi:MAG: acyltransferase domain-containing protein, partial [Pseudonocardiaceae bacterium]